MKHAKPTPNRIKYLPLFVFIIFIFCFAIWFIFAPKTKYSSNEKRYLSDFPVINVENVLSGQFGEDFEKFFADHFPLRSFFVGANSYYNLAIGNNGADGVYYCKNGYLINEPINSDSTLKRNLTAITDFAEIVDVPVNAMFVPSTGYIMDDVLPKIHNKYNDDEYFELCNQKLSDSNINFVDLRDDFKQAYSNNTQLYYKTDHHWTTEGAFIAYNIFCNSQKLSPVKKDIFTIKNYENFYGTTYSTSGFWFNGSDVIQVWNNTNNSEKNISVEITEDGKTEKFGSLFFYNHLNEDDKYPVFIDGNHALTTIVNSNVKSGTIVVVKDSFSHCFAPFIAENYNKVILVDMRYYKKSVSDIVKENNAEQVLFLYGIDNIAKDTDLVWIK